MKYIISILKWFASIFVSASAANKAQLEISELHKQRRCTNCNSKTVLKRCHKRNESGTVGCIDPWPHLHAYCQNKKCKFVGRVYVLEIGEKYEN